MIYLYYVAMLIAVFSFYKMYMIRKNTLVEKGQEDGSPKKEGLSLLKLKKAVNELKPWSWFFIGSICVIYFLTVYLGYIK